MFNIKSSLQRIFDWDGWRWVCYFELMCFLVVTMYYIVAAIFLSFSLSGKSSSTDIDMVYIGLIVSTSCLISVLSIFFLKIRNFYRVILMPAIFIGLIALELYLITNLFFQPNIIYIDS
jgi:hypothetical protein